MTKKHLAKLAQIQMEISHCANRNDSSKLIELMEKQMGVIDGIIDEEVNKIIPDLQSGWGPGYALKYLTEDYIRKIAERQIGLLQATEKEDTQAMGLAQIAYFTTIENVIQLEVSKALTLSIKYSNIKKFREEDLQ